MAVQTTLMSVKFGERTYTDFDNVVDHMLFRNQGAANVFNAIDSYINPQYYQVMHSFVNSATIDGADGIDVATARAFYTTSLGAMLE